MRFKYGTEIYNHQQEKVGELKNVVIDPAEDEVTHLIIRKGFFFSKDKILPIELVASAASGRIHLHPFRGDLEDLPDYQRKSFIETMEPDRFGPVIDMSGLYMYTPVDYSPVLTPRNTVHKKKKYHSRKTQNLPEDQQNISKNIPIETYLGTHIGDVEEIIVDPQTDDVTHFVVSKGLILKEEKLIPADWVKKYRANKIVLAVNQDTVNKLPAYP